MAGALRELLASFNIEVDDHELKKGHEAVEGFVETLKGMGEVILGAFAVDQIKEFVSGQVEAATGLERTAIRLGTTTDELQAMNFAAAEGGVSAESLANGLRLLNLHLAESGEGGGKAAQLFREAGIAIKNTDGTTRAAGDVFADLADHIASIDDPAKQTQLAMRLLGRGGVELIPLLKQGGQAFRDAAKDVAELGGGYSEGFIEQAKQAEKQQAKLNFALTSLKGTVVAALLPSIQKIVHWFTNLTKGALDVNRRTAMLETGLRALAVVAGVKTGQALLALAGKMGLLKESAIGTLRALAGFALPAAALIVLYLAFDELYNLLKGNDSVIGDALGPDKQQFVHDLQAAIDSLSTTLGDLDTALGGDGTAMGLFRDVVVGTAKDVAALIEVVAKAKDVVKNLTLGLTIGGELGRKIAFGNETERNLAIGEYQTSKEGQERGKALDAEKDRQYRAESDQAAIMDAARNKYRAEHAASLGQAASEPGAIEAYGVREPPAHMLPHPPGGPAGGEAAAPVITTTNTFHTEVHSDSNKPQDVADAVNGGLATQVQRSNARTLAAVSKP